MNANTQNGRGDLPIGWVEDQLRALAAVEPPASLKDRLVAGIPGAAAAKPRERCIWVWSREARWAGAAAGVIVVASVVSWLGTPFGRQVRPAPEAGTHAGWALATDYNSLGASDTNFCDTNGLR